MLNRTHGRLARLTYLAGNYRIAEPGDHVLCAVTSQPIPLDSLRYWSAELQEAYASPDIAVKRYAEMKAKGRL